MNSAASVDRPISGGPILSESAQSAVSWAAIIAGAFASIAITLILLALGAGVGLASISPWPNSGVSVTTFTITTGIGLIVVQWLASAIGGYMTGRLRTKWTGVHTHEIFFRDTAHGFLSWTLATVVGSLLLASAASSVVGGGIRAAATVAGSAAQGTSQMASRAASEISAYDVDSLFRSERPDSATTPQAANDVVTRILASGITSGSVPASDRNYLAQLVAGRAGLSQEDAEKRVDDVIVREQAAVDKAKQVADAARRATSQFAIFMALSMLIGAFIAGVAAAYGGSLRDDH